MNIKIRKSTPLAPTRNGSLAGSNLSPLKKKTLYGPQGCSRKQDIGDPRFVDFDPFWTLLWSQKDPFAGLLGLSDTMGGEFFTTRQGHEMVSKTKRKQHRVTCNASEYPKIPKSLENGPPQDQNRSKNRQKCIDHEMLTQQSLARLVPVFTHFAPCIDRSSAKSTYSSHFHGTAWWGTTWGGA